MSPHGAYHFGVSCVENVLLLSVGLNNFFYEIIPTADNNSRIVLSVVIRLDVNIETRFSLAIFDLALVVNSAFV